MLRISKPECIFRMSQLAWKIPKLSKEKLESKWSVSFIGTNWGSLSRKKCKEQFSANSSIKKEQEIQWTQNMINYYSIDSQTKIKLNLKWELKSIWLQISFRMCTFNAIIAIIENVRMYDTGLFSLSPYNICHCLFFPSSNAFAYRSSQKRHCTVPLALNNLNTLSICACMRR